MAKYKLHDSGPWCSAIS